MTSFGLINLTNVVDVQKALNSHILNQTSPFPIPVDWGTTYPDIYNTSLAFDIYWGEQNSDFDSFSFIQKILLLASLIIIFIDSIKNTVIFLSYKYNDNSKK